MKTLHWPSDQCWNACTI